MVLKQNLTSIMPNVLFLKIEHPVHVQQLVLHIIKWTLSSEFCICFRNEFNPHLLHFSAYNLRAKSYENLTSDLSGNVTFSRGRAFAPLKENTRALCTDVIFIQMQRIRTILHIVKW